jgi:pyruvate formate lyase activating enzyme
MPNKPAGQSFTVATRYWRTLDNGRVECTLCPRACRLAEGQRGLCFVRANESGRVVMTSYGRSSGFCVDPIEKKPLNHFYPGSAVLSFGTAGCNLACKFCQNWDISKSREIDTLAAVATPSAIARAAQAQGCKSVAFTYNDPVIYHEYAIDVAAACRALGLKSVAVTAGYVCAEPRREFFRFMDAANVDLKAFSDDFYRRVTGARLAPVLETLEYIVHETNTWLEITCLLIPGYNDTSSEIEQLAGWVREHLGPNVPLHFSAFHPDWKMRDIDPTPPSVVRRARKIALGTGLNYVYTGNIEDREGDATTCHGCGTRLIQRSWYEIDDCQLDQTGQCPTCATPCAGHFAARPGNWGRRRQPISV